MLHPGVRSRVLSSQLYGSFERKRTSLPNDVILDVPELLPHGGAKFFHGVANNAAEVLVPELTDIVDEAWSG